ncbi:unnamed protein product, partial [Ectocarpus sp. 6 AP-2014]
RIVWFLFAHARWESLPPQVDIGRRGYRLACYYVSPPLCLVTDGDDGVCLQSVSCGGSTVTDVTQDIAPPGSILKARLRHHENIQQKETNQTFSESCRRDRRLQRPRFRRCDSYCCCGIEL